MDNLGKMYGKSRENVWEIYGKPRENLWMGLLVDLYDS